MNEKRHQKQGDEENKENAQDDGQDVARQPIVNALRLGRRLGAIDLGVAIVACEERRPLGGRILIRHFWVEEEDGSPDVPGVEGGQVKT